MIALQQPFVYTRRRWSDKWIHQPNLFPITVEDGVGPNLPTARFLWRHGNTSTDSAAFAIVVPADLVGQFVQVRRPLTAAERLADPEARPLPIWTGRFTIDRAAPGGGDDADTSDLPFTGSQVLAARGLAFDLHRCRIYGSVAEIDSTATRIDSVFNFNVSTRRGGAPTGNRSAAKYVNTANGLESYIFADSSGGAAATWRASDIIEYLLTWFTPADQSWQLAGQRAVLDVFTRVVAPGRSVASTIDQLVDRRNGAAWSMLPSVLITSEIAIHSLLSDAVIVGGSTVPANTTGAYFDPDVEQVESIQVTRSSEHRYKRIVARGERLVLCGSLTVSDGADNGWTAAAQTAYDAATDAERISEKYRQVYTTFILSDPTASGTKLFYDGNGGRTGTCPSIAANGQLDEAAAAAIFLSEKTLLRQLPLLTGYTYSGGSVILSDTADPHEFLPPFVLVKGEVGGVAAWGFVDRPASLDANRYSAGMSLTMLDDAPGFRIKATPPHTLALNSFTGTSGFPAKYDYRDMIATVAIASDIHLQITRNVGTPAEAADADESTTLVIDVPGAEAWYVCPGTVVDCINGEPTRTPNGIVARNDRADLEAVADLAVAWYKRDRHALKIDFKVPYYGFSPGDMITTTDPEGRVFECNSMVTRVRWDFLPRLKTTVQTDFAELDFVGFARRGPGRGALGASARPLTRDTAATNSPVRIGATPDGSGDETGMVKAFTGDTVPTGYLLCDGSSYSTTEYADLFAVIAYKYGGAGANFNVPDLGEQVIRGWKDNDPDYGTLGATGGVETITHDHTHTPSMTVNVDNRAALYAVWDAGGPTGSPTWSGSGDKPTGANHETDNRGPWTALKWVIKT